MCGLIVCSVLWQGQFVGVIGKVGSGKSSLLAAITAEMSITQGEVCSACDHHPSSKFVHDVPCNLHACLL